MRIALFGCGRIGRVHADAIASHPRAELAWVCDPMQDIARELAAQHATSATADTAAVLADPTIDAVVIASSTPTHVDLLARAVRSGKAVLCEKPIDLDIARVDACWAEIGAAEPLVMVGFNRRFDSSIREVRDRIRAGEIGRLEQLAITSRDPAPPPAEYIAKSGGLFRDMTIHDLDLARFMLGEVVEVQAMGANLVEDYVEKCGDIDTAVVIMRSAGGALCQIANSRHCAFGYDQRLEAFGSTGMLAVHNQLPTSVRYAGPGRTEAAGPYSGFFLERYGPTYRAELDHFITAVEKGGPLEPGFADGRAALVLANAADKSMRTGSAVPIAPAPPL